MIPTHCRHRTHPPPGAHPIPKECAKGIRYADVALPDQRPIWNAQPCFEQGRANGATCPHFAPWTPEEIATDRAETEALMAALGKGVCPKCGATLVRQGVRFACPTDPEHVSGFACSPRETP